MNETNVIASRRSFLTRMAYGSLLAMSGSSIAEAAVKHVTHSTTHKKPDVKHANKPDTKHTNKSTKSALHERLALKSENNRHHSKTADTRHHPEHKELALNSHSRIHSSLHKDHNGHHLHDDLRERIALQNKQIIQHSSHKDRHVDMPEFAMQEQEFDAPRFHSNDIRSQFAAPRTNRVIVPNRSNSNVSHKALALQNTTTGDSLNVTYFEHGRYLPDALHEINFLYRDHLTDEVHPIDTALLDQLHDLQANLGINKRPIHVICGYRSPFTNAHLRRNSHGVAKNSLHMEGRAIDIRIAGIESSTVREAALSMARGGVGYYPGSNFVHLDTGGFRTW